MECLICLLVSLIIIAMLMAMRPKSLKNFAAKHGLHYSMGLPLLAGATVTGQYYGVPIRIYIRYNFVNFSIRRSRRTNLPEIVYELRMGNCIPPGIQFYKTPLISFRSSVLCNIPHIDQVIYIRKVDSQTAHRLFSRPGVQDAVLSLIKLDRPWICENNLLIMTEMHLGVTTERIEENIERLVSIVRSFQDAHAAALDSQPAIHNPQITSPENPASSVFPQSQAHPPKTHEIPHQY